MRTFTGDKLKYSTYNFGSNDGNWYYIIPISRFNNENSNKALVSQAMLFWCQYKLIPQLINHSKEFKALKNIYKYKDYLIAGKDNILLDQQKIFEAVMNKTDFDFLPHIQKSIDTVTVEGDESFVNDLRKELLECDHKRAMLDIYDENILTDPNRGHWDLWDYGRGAEPAGQVKLGRSFVARNPTADINHGIVGIDFGTKSTVVVFEDERGKIMPLQVGSGTYSKGVSRKNYENPTIIEFINIDEFVKAYKSRAGRPPTSWNDVTVSHTAMDDLSNATTSELYNSFFENIKQWCGNANKIFNLRDQQGKEISLKPFEKIDEDDLNPLKIYAYYLGLYMNHMLQTRHIFMHYILSFPVTYENELREKMRQSFEDGIKKSLPTALLANERAMKEFVVEEGTSEPAAYAITALEEYGFTDSDEEVYYAVFDFGGGTTDFDFGVLREADSDRYDYVLTHFGANGDRTLGGENLLKLLAFEVFKANLPILLKPKDLPEGVKGKIPFTYAAKQDKFLGSEGIIRDSQEANLNMHNLAEALRPLWEVPDSEAAQDILNSNIVKVNLFMDDESSTQLTNYELSINFDDQSDKNKSNDKKPTTSKLEQILRKRITEGVDNFFIALREAFDKSSGGKTNKVAVLSEVSRIAIFFAGNSTKSKLVKEIFDEYISDKGRARKLLGFGSDQKMPKFEIYPPLGTEEAYQLQEEHGLKVDRSNLETPTGKTGVAFGLLKCRGGADIKVVDITPDEKQVPFQFYVGRRKKKQFRVVIDPTMKLNEWKFFIDASEPMFDILYTTEPSAATNDQPHTIATHRPIRLEEDKVAPDNKVYIRAIDSKSIQYVVAKNTEELANLKDLKPVTITLNL